MKKIISTIMVVLMLGFMCLGLVSCGGDEVEYGPYNIGIVHGGETDAAKEATVNFITALQSSVGSDKLTIYILAETQEMADAIKNDSGNKDNSKVSVYASADLKAGVNSWLITAEHDLDLISATTNKAVEACKVHVKSIPVVANSVAYANAEKNTSIGSDGTEVVETIKIPSSMGIAPIDAQVSYIEELSSGSNKKISFVYDSANLDSSAKINAIVKELEVKGYTCSEFDVADLAGAFANDVVYIVEDAKTLSAAEAIKALNTDSKTVIASSKALYDACADSTLSINYSMVGINAADIAFDILVNSKTYAQAKEIGDKYVSIARKESK
ncbi:MAG: hypothetical protein J6B60_00900 [Clostridia bacterium]|nr:hypothetical protein [Clostridia bacterium]